MKTKSENVFGFPTPCQPSPPSQRRLELKMWKQLKTSTLDKLGLLILNGSLTSKKRNVKIRVTLQMRGFYRLSFSKHTSTGRTTSRHATPPGDGRGVPKHFRDFGSFSRCSTAFSQPTLPEGFALGRKRSPSVFQSRNPAGTVTVFVVQGPSSRVTLIYADITKMDLNDPSPSESLIDLIDSVDFGFPSDTGDLSIFQMTDEQLNVNLPPRLQSPNNALSSTPSIFPTSPTYSTSIPPNAKPPQPPSSRTDSTSVIQYAPPPQILSSPICPTRVLPNAQHPQSASSPNCSTSLLTAAQSLQPPMSPKLSLSSPAPLFKRIGPNTFELITKDDNVSDNNPSDLGFESQPSSSSASSSSPFPSSSTALSPPTPVPESKEEKNRRACGRYREKMKAEAAELPEELKCLERRNRELRATVQQLEEVVAWHKSLLKGASRKRMGEGGGSERKGKRRRS